MSATTEGWRLAGRRGADWLIEDAVDSGYRPRAAAAVFWTPIAGWVVLAALFVAARPAFYLLQQEDHVVEWAQFALCLFTAGAALVAVRRLGFKPRPASIFLVLVALGCFFLAGEEISWGQRVIGIETPEAIAEANRQSETNLHNIDIGLDPQTLFKVGSAALGLLGLTGIVVVRILGRGGGSARLLAPPAVTAPGFAGIVAYWVIMVITGHRVAPLLRFQEWVECALYISLSAAVVAVVLRASDREKGVRKLRQIGVGVVLLTVVFALLTPLSGVTPGNV